MLTTVASMAVSPPASSIPAPGEAPMPAANAAALFRRNATGERGSLRAIRFEDRVWTHAEFYAASARWAQLFASRRAADPKAWLSIEARILIRVTRLGMFLEVGPDDVGYLAMPLFHSNSLMVGWAPSIVYGASVALARRFSASGWLPDIRRHGATWFSYTGKPLAYILATPEGPDDSHNPLRVAFGNEGSPRVVEEFSRRFGVEVIDAFGATEGGVAVNREPDMPAGAMGRVGESVKVVDEEGHELGTARFDVSGRLVNAEECVGEIVNTA